MVIIAVVNGGCKPPCRFSMVQFFLPGTAGSLHQGVSSFSSLKSTSFDVMTCGNGNNLEHVLEMESHSWEESYNIYIYIYIDMFGYQKVVP